jgi:hypothetical protein
MGPITRQSRNPDAIALVRLFQRNDVPGFPKVVEAAGVEQLHTIENTQLTDSQVSSEVTEHNKKATFTEGLYLKFTRARS